MKLGISVAALIAALAMAAPASALTTSGVSGDLEWSATSSIVGVTSTATGAAGGNPIYFPDWPRLSGTVALIMQQSNGLFICSGSLLSDRRSILTAGHCVSSGAGTANPIATTAYFYGGPNPDQVVPLQPAATAVTVSEYYVNADYTGEVIDQNDIAVLRLSDFAPAFATSYDLYTGDDLTGLGFNVAGYGARSDTGGNIGANLGTGRLRQGDNRYDFRLGDADFGGDFTTGATPGTNGFGGDALVDFSYLSDFDNGLTANDASCQLATLAFGLGGPKYCDLGVGAREVSTAGGDSGGPQFINGQIASVTSYGLTFRNMAFGDIDNALNSSFGEFNGFVPVSIHRDFIASVTPEPGTWAVMLMGFFGLGIALRACKAAATA